jgi:hypothetical protein
MPAICQQTAKQIATGWHGGVWIIGTDNILYALDADGKTWDRFPAPPQTPTKVTADASGSPWVIGTAPTRNNTFKWNWNSSSWTTMPGGATQIATGSDGSVWTIGCAPYHKLYYYNGTDWNLFATQPPAQGNDSLGQVWVVGSYPWVNYKNYSYSYRWNGTQWISLGEFLGGNGDYFACGGPNNDVYYSGHSTATIYTPYFYPLEKYNFSTNQFELIKSFLFYGQIFAIDAIGNPISVLNNHIYSAKLM